MIEPTEPSLPPTFVDRINAELPGVLYHYTNQDGLLGILQESELWASQIQYMNDITEFRVAAKLVLDRIKTSNERASERVSRWINEFSGKNCPHIFVACFCRCPDLLSQWRGYGQGGPGFSIGFDSTKLKDFGKQCGFKLGKCIYKGADQEEAAEEIATTGLRYANAPNQNTNDMAIANLVLQWGAFFKDSSFEQEEEWRLVSYPKLPSDRKIRFRRGKSMITPYYGIPIGKGSESAVQRIFVGPSPHMVDSVRSAGYLMHSCNLGSDAQPSKIPFRDW